MNFLFIDSHMMSGLNVDQPETEVEADSVLDAARKLGAKDPVIMDNPTPNTVMVGVETDDGLEPLGMVCIISPLSPNDCK